MRHNKIVAFSALFAGAFLLVGCKSYGLSSNSSSEAASASSYVETTKYVKGFRAYDSLYDYDGCKDSSFVLDSFPGLVFERSNEIKKYVSVKGLDGLSHLESIYYGDVNGDGHMDLGYTKRARPELANRYEMRVFIYDFLKGEIVFDSGVESSYVLDLDENGNLIIEEMGGGYKNGEGFAESLKSGRFLVGDKADFEWFDLDFKIKTISLMPEEKNFDFASNKAVFPVGEECSIPIWINCIGKTNPLSANSFEVSADSAEFTYLLSPRQTVLNPLFVITCKFDTAGEFELRIAAGDLSDTKTVVVS